MGTIGDKMRGATSADSGMNCQPSKDRGVINCDQAWWFLDALSRFQVAVIMSGSFPGISRVTEGAKMSCMVEIAEILNMDFDEGAKSNIASRCFRELAKGEK